MRRLLLAVVLLLSPPTLAADVRIVSAIPEAQAGTWTVVASVPKKPVFLADSTALEVESTEPVGDLARIRLAGVPPSFERLVLGTGEGAKFKPLAAIAASATTGVAASHDDLTIYHVMLEMFRNGAPANDGEIKGWKHPNYAGGDLQGLTEKLGYIRELGANAIWISPTFAARTSHGYDVLDYGRIADQAAVPGDPAASLEVFRTLVRKAHENGVKVILDLPLNHASRAYDLEKGDPLGLKPRSTGPMQPAEKTWESWGGGYRYWNFDHEPTRRFLRAAALRWLKDERVDGLRLDYVRGVPHDFWAELHAEVRAAAPAAFLVGECWADEQGADGNAREIASYYAPVPGKGPQFGSLLDFPMQATLTDAFARGGSALALEDRLQSDLALYGPGARPVWFLDNHDMSRFASFNSDPERLEAAVAFMASLSGPMVLFYGTETGLQSGAPKPGFTDAGRVPMPWSALDEERISRVRRVLEARAAHPALRRGARLPLHADRQAVVMAKTTPEETLLVGSNVSDAPTTVTFDAPTAATAFATVLGTTVPSRERDGRLRWTLPPKSTSIASIAKP
ncbi:MAG TPA: alpha-amylase family glycosyl hydrolase [Candidatus Polarisedimenticolaceae bacterium]